MITTSRMRRRIYFYSYVFKKLGILSEQEYNKITNPDTLELNR